MFCMWDHHNKYVGIKGEIGDWHMKCILSLRMMICAEDDLVFILLLKLIFLSCRHTFGWLSAYLPCFHVNWWFLSSPPGTISLPEIPFNLSMSSIFCDQPQSVSVMLHFHQQIESISARWSLNPYSTYCTKRCRKEDRRESLDRKRKVLYLVSQWMELCNDFLRDDERVKLFMKVRDAPLCSKTLKLKAWREEWKSMLPFRLCAVTCWMTFTSTRPWKRMLGSCRNFTCSIADSEWLRLAVLLSASVRHIDNYTDWYNVRIYRFGSRRTSMTFKVWKSADVETELLFCSILINESIQRLKRNCSVLGGVTVLCVTQWTMNAQLF